MKRGRHDGDYDRVRRDAGYSKPRPEFPDEEEDRAVAARVAQKNEEFKARMAELEQQDIQREHEARQRLSDRRREIDQRLILRDYERLGIRPSGDILVSVSLLLKLGWHIEQVDGKETLIRPMATPQKAPDTKGGRKTREDYERERAVNAEGS